MRVVHAAVTPRVAAQDAPARQYRAAHEPELAERVDRVLRAARVVLARPGGSQEPEGEPPGVDEADACVPHEPAFSRTAAISSTSQPLPRVSAGSARPGLSGQDVVTAGRNGGEEVAPALAQQPLHAVPRDRRADRARHRESEPRVTVGLVVTREPVQDQIRGSTRNARAGRRCRSPSTGKAGCGAALRYCANPGSASADSQVARKPLKADVSRRIRGPISRQPHLTRKGACALSRDGASGSHGPRGMTCALGIRGAAFCGERSAGRCVSRLLVGLQRCGAASIDNRSAASVVHRACVSLASRNSLLTRSLCCRKEQRIGCLPHLWNRMWILETPCKIRRIFIHGDPIMHIERPRRGCYARHLPTTPDARGWVDHPAEQPADDLWNAIAERLRDTLTGSAYETGFGQARPRSFEGEEARGGGPERLHARLDPASSARSGTSRHERVAQGCRRLVRRRGADAGGARGAGRTRSRAVARTDRRVARVARDSRGRAEPQVHVRPLRHRVVQPVRARRGTRGRRSAGAGVQPTLHLREDGPRQDPSAPGDRTLRPPALTSLDDAVRDQRDVHERVHRRRPRAVADRRLQASLPQLRHPPRRRHPVLRGQGADPGRVLPHVQLALRGRCADRHLVRPAATGHRRARRPASLAFRVGSPDRHPGSRPRDADRDPAQAGRDRGDPGSGSRGADLHRGARQREHPRARRGAHAGRRLLLAHRPPAHRRTCRDRSQRTSTPKGRQLRRSRSRGSSRTCASGSRSPTRSSSARVAHRQSPIRDRSPCTSVASSRTRRCR